MRRLIALVVGLLALAGASGATGASGERVVQLKQLDATVAPFVNRYWSDVCGFEVVMQADGSYDVTLFYGEDGMIVRQVNTYPSITWTLSAPANETAITWRAALQAHATYEGGARVDGPVEVRYTGRNGRIPGLPSDAGQRVYSGEVVGFSPNGVPEWDGVFGGFLLLTEVGNWNDQEAVDTAICTALGNT